MKKVKAVTVSGVSTNSISLNDAPLAYGDRFMMAEYFDLGTNLNYMVGTLEDNNYRFSDIRNYIGSYLGFGKKTEVTGTPTTKPPPPVSKELLHVRDSICVVGYNQTAVQAVKQQIASLVPDPLPLESLHLHSPTDLKQGALLVPKVVMVAVHCPGKKLIDDDGDSGQLDEVYDEVCDTGADILLVYMNLPRAIYPSMRHMVYHPRMAELVFPTQPTLRSLAENYSLVTVRERSELSSMQKNVIREWLMRPVGKDHPVYAKCDKLRTEMTFSDAEFWSETELYKYQRPVPSHTTTQYASAYEYKSSPEKPSKKKAIKKKHKTKRVPVGQLIELDGADGGHMELEMYNGETKESDTATVGSLTV